MKFETCTALPKSRKAVGKYKGPILRFPYRIWVCWYLLRRTHATPESSSAASSELEAWKSHDRLGNELVVCTPSAGVPTIADSRNPLAQVDIEEQGTAVINHGCAIE